MTRDHDMVGPSLEFGCNPYHEIDKYDIDKVLLQHPRAGLRWQDMCQWRGNGFRMVKGGRVLKW